MIPDFKRHTLANIATITKKLKRIKPAQQEKQKNILYKSLASDFQLLQNDVLLILKHNFYLQCKLKQQGEKLGQFDKKYNTLEAHLSLQIKMLKQKYERQIQQLKFNKFMTNIEQSPLRLNYRRHSSDYKEEEPKILTRHKDIILHQQNQQHNNSQTAVKFKKYQDMENIIQGTVNKAFSSKLINQEQQSQRYHQFDLKLRFDEFQDVKSEQKTVSKPSAQMIKQVYTDNFQDQYDRRRHKKGYFNHEHQQKPQKQITRKKKSQQLAQLVAQQFKISKIKETYFSKEL